MNGAIPNPKINCMKKKIIFLFGGESHEGIIVSIQPAGSFHAIEVENVHVKHDLKYVSFTIIATEVAPGLHGVITIVSIHDAPFSYVRLLTM